MLKRAMERVLVVGAGLTGSLTGAAIRQYLPQGAQIVIWDKSRGAGGRMSTSRSDEGTIVDLGAQYISLTPEYQSKHHKYYTELLNAEILKPLNIQIEGERDHPPNTKHFTTPQGISSVVKYYLKKAGVDVNFGFRVTAIHQVDGDNWRVETESGHNETFTSVILTQPVQQILQLGGAIQDIISNNVDVKTKLKNVQYSSRFALGLFYSSSIQLPLPWSARYFYDDPCIRYISVDNQKRNKDEEAPSICVHTSVPFGIQHLDDSLDIVQAIIMQHLQRLLPDLPQPAQIKPHKWRYSQVHQAYDGKPGCVVLNQQPMLVCAGDAFVHSNFDGCIESAEAVIKLFDKKYTALHHR